MDGFLKKEVKIIIIGGTAAALAYKVSKATQDIVLGIQFKGSNQLMSRQKLQLVLRLNWGRYQSVMLHMILKIVCSCTSQKFLRNLSSMFRKLLTSF